MTSLTTFIFGILLVAMGVFVGAAWGLSRHVELLDWLEARTIRRWMQAMQSLGYEQWRIDQVLEQMGQRIMPPYIPVPEPPVKKSLEERLWEKNIGVIYREELTPFGEIIMKICLNYADKINEAATEEDGFLFRVLEDRMRDELLHGREYQFGSKPVVRITWNRRAKLDAPDHKYIQVEFNLEKYNASEL